ncbi:hypothetical protein ACVIN2_005273 [Bradyrhizobium sp. USDA 3650]
MVHRAANASRHEAENSTRAQVTDQQSKTASSVHESPAQNRVCRDVAKGQERYCSLSLPDMMSK